MKIATIVGTGLLAVTFDPVRGEKRSTDDE